MSDGTDASVGVLEPGSPTKLIDNSLVSGRYRQRVDAPTVADLLRNLVWLAEVLVGKTSQQNVAGQVRALLESGSTTAVTGTLTGVTTVSNVASVGGLAASYDQYSQINACAFALRDRIVVT